MKKKVVCLLSALLLAVSVAFPAAAAFNRDVLDSVVVVYVEIYNDDELYGYATGTGFFVGESGEDPQYLVTNYHVLEYYVATGGGDGTSLLRVFFSQDDIEEAYVVEYSEEKDLAVLRLSKPTEKRRPLTLEAPTSEMVGSTVYAVGYPSLADSDQVANPNTRFGTEDATVTTGSFSRLLVQSGTGREIIQSDTAVHGGNSGGPLVNDAGHVIGINTFGIESNGTEIETINYALSVNEVIPLLDRNSIAYDLATASNLPLPLPVLLAIGAAVVIAAAVVVILAVRGRRTAPAPAPAAAGPAPAPDPVPASMPAPMPAMRQAYVRSSSPQHGGQRFPVGSQPFLIGRDPSSCSLVYRGGTPGVSSRHCSVSYNADTGEFLLTDLRSTYGTFLENGQRLEPGVPFRLQPGSVFYLGERDNSVRVELG